jgi:hypothetical protein
VRIGVVRRHGLGRLLTSTEGEILSQGVGAIVREDIIEEGQGEMIRAGGQVVQMTLPWHDKKKVVDKFNITIDNNNSGSHQEVDRSTQCSATPFPRMYREVLWYSFYPAIRIRNEQLLLRPHGPLRPSLILPSTCTVRLNILCIQCPHPTTVLPSSQYP